MNTVLRSTGMMNPHARFAITIVDVWKWTHFCFSVKLVGIESLPDDIYEASMLVTSPEWQMFRFITLPLIEPALFTVTILR